MTKSPLVANPLAFIIEDHKSMAKICQTALEQAKTPVILTSADIPACPLHSGVILPVFSKHSQRNYFC